MSSRRGRVRHRLKRLPLESESNISVPQDLDKPRPECPYQDFYPDLDAFRKLPIFLIRATSDHIEKESEQSHKNLDSSHEPCSSPRINTVNNNNQANGLANISCNDTGGGGGAEQTSKKPGYRHQKAIEYPSVKIDKKLSLLGYCQPNQSFKLPDTYNKIASELHEAVYFKSRRQVKDNHKEQMPFLVEYDMDEQDNVFLQDFNRRRMKKYNANAISNQIFECIMTLFELEWFNIESKMPPKNKITVTGEISDSTDDQKCLICDESDCDNSNAIVFCDGCDIAVHQDCYGVPFIPEGQWHCRQCAISRRRKASCIFCPNKSGAFKQTDTQHWAHVLCALWIPEAWFSNHVYMEPICGLDRIPKGRWKLNCYICKQKVGACIQCVNKSCFQAFHPTCARKARLCMRMLGGIQGALNNPGSLLSYCDKHTPDDYEEDVTTNVINAQRHYDEIRRASKAEGQTAMDRPTIIKENRIIRRKSKGTKPWRTEQGTPALPVVATNKIIDRVDQLFKLDKIPELVYELSRYWVLKRQWKRGAALTKRLQLALEMQPSHPNSVEETREKLDYYEGLLDNLKVVQELTGLIREREVIKYNLAQTQKEIIDLVNFPIQHLIFALWTKLLSVSHKSLDLEIITKVEEKVRNRQYKKISDFENDLFGYLDSVTSTYPRGSVEYREAVRIHRTLAPAISRALAYSQSITRHPDNEDIADFRAFGVKGLAVSQEEWGGVRVRREMSPFSDIDDDALYELEYGRRKRLRSDVT